MKAMKPLINHCKDTVFPLTSITHHRTIARAFVVDDKGFFAFNHILIDDKFGHRDYLETAGGGLESNESIEQAVLREVEEELGYTSTILSFLGIVEDDYHLIQRHNIQYYYLVKVKEKTKTTWTETEKRMIHQMVWLSLSEAIAYYSSLKDEGIALLIKQRELPLLNFIAEEFPQFLSRKKG
jgi:8-oxo-dGTP pyrophosphatase MutT (NUDIX family)